MTFFITVLVVKTDEYLRETTLGLFQTLTKKLTDSSR